MAVSIETVAWLGIDGTRRRARPGAQRWRTLAGAVLLAACFCHGSARGGGQDGAPPAVSLPVAALPAAPAPSVPAAPSSGLQVLHWWTSASERKAADLLAARLAGEGVEWRDEPIHGGAGIGAGKVLKGKVLAGDPPQATQIIGVAVAEWSEMGLLLELDNVAGADNWSGVLFPTVQNLIQYRKHTMAAPLGIHRVNTLFYNRALFARLKLAPPRTWAEFDAVAQRLAAAGIAPLAQSSEAWQVATLFENLVLAESGPGFYRELFVRRNPAAAADPRTAHALERLRTVKGWSRGQLAERPWTEVVRRFARGEAGMMIMGDWAKAELNERGTVLDRDYGCAGAPGTGGYHLYSVDTLSMFAGDYRHAQAQEKMARLLVSPAVQADYNVLKGSVPARRDADPARMDSCARASWTIFARGGEVQAPSMVHRMAVDEASRDAIIAEVHRFFLDDRAAVAVAQRRLAALFRLFNITSQGMPGAQDTDRRR